MALRALARDLDPVEKIVKISSTAEKLSNTLCDELIIAFCCPIGSLREPVQNALINVLRDFNYSTQIIRLSSIITDSFPYDKKSIPGHSDGYSELMHKIHKGNELRKKHGNSVLVDIAISEILENRFRNNNIDHTKPYDPRDIKSQRICYIINSIKNIEELNVLKSVYRDNFYLISIFTPMVERKKLLAEIYNLNPREVQEIVKTDSYDELLYGQNVRDTFTQGDLILRVPNGILSEIEKKISRFLNLLFDSEIITPTSNESAMFAAKTAACNSSCLFRQVGASITDQKMHVIATGWNDVPKNGGNLYRDGDLQDHRCCKHEFCNNTVEIKRLSHSILNSFEEDDEVIALINSLKIEPETQSAILKFIAKKLDSTLSKSKIKDLLEYSRSVHAEMHAIIIGSQQTGDKMLGGFLFCTTYPCHHCARHIILAGIKTVYYIEPYTKSLALSLHGDDITEDEFDTSNKVKILAFDGISPNRYLDLFSMTNDSRKTKDGTKKVRQKVDLKLRNRITLHALSTLEEQAVATLIEKKVFEDVKKT